MNTRLTIDQSRNHYCGPLVLAAILGVDTAEAARQVRAHCGVTMVKSMSNWQVRRVLEANGYRMSALQIDKQPRSRMVFGRLKTLAQGPTLTAWLRTRDDINLPYIVNVGHHYVLVKGRKFVDTYTKGEWVFLRSAPHRRKRVREAFRISRAPVV